jgi:tRNA(Ile)-lysidine synthetase-like protein
MPMQRPGEIFLQPVPAGGRWAVGVSGGADSVALLLLLHQRNDLQLHVVHLDHQTRGEFSRKDAEFVSNLAANLKIPFTLEIRERLESRFSHLPKNPSARYRLLRIELFRRVIHDEKLQGVILGHHADDQAETIVQRLLRGSGAAGLAGMSGQSCLSGMTILRPLLQVRRQQLRDFLQQVGQSWREDASNQSEKYQRNRIRQWLTQRPELFQLIVNLGDWCRHYSQWIRRNAPPLPAVFASEKLASLPRPLACEASRRWLLSHRAKGSDLTPDVLARLCAMASDAATPAKQQFPGPLMVRRKSGKIFADPSTR